ncbi:acetyltransferase (GNAT) family protein [Lutibacter sp. Hel_I_33_5]|uniref:GNAT family N-acetyltransferase n=1 Tax=Lutibacter sp. Hel_I_33_5 TaxID=1566289 RepID=UPI0011AA2DF3|nr:GNAT family N-acetyltransferase [Lutibacter sp. Hel_I_33_5]TVZ56370.1 acetyltransferase (GNAT) family protein [Lutibacter sp. Hel_I_33_5]
MIKISENIQLKEIKKTDCETLFQLMKEVYPLAYSHFWEDKGDWYVNTQYSKENILKEISEEKAAYYLVIYKDEIIGNFRIIWDERLEGLSQEKQVKLHRIYLHQKTQGNGIGKTILVWLEKKAKEKNYKIIWLDAMDEQPQAFQFYKKLGFKYHSHTFLPFELLHDEVRKMSQLYKKI